MLSCSSVYAFNHVDLYHGLQRVYSRYINAFNFLSTSGVHTGTLSAFVGDARQSQQQNARNPTVALLILKIPSFVVVPAKKAEFLASRVDSVKLVCGVQNFLLL